MAGLARGSVGTGVVWRQAGPGWPCSRVQGLVGGGLVCSGSDWASQSLLTCRCSLACVRGSGWWPQSRHRASETSWGPGLNRQEAPLTRGTDWARQGPAQPGGARS